MAHGDEQTVEFGPFRNWTRRSIDIAAGTSTVDIVPANSTGTIQLGPCSLTIEGEAEVALIEEDGETLEGPHNVVTGATVGVIALNGNEGIQSTTSNKAIQATRSASVGLSGRVIYKNV